MKNEKTLFYWFGWQGVGVFSWFMWVMSSFMSYWGFTMLNHAAPWWIKLTAAGLAVGINFVEFMFNRMTLDELLEFDNVGDIVLRIFGVICYAYDIYTNVIAFIVVVMISSNVTTLSGAFRANVTMAIFAVFFGIAFAVGPEPLYIKFLKEKFPFPGYTPKYKGATLNTGRSTELSPAVLEYLKKKTG